MSSDKAVTWVEVPRTPERTWVEVPRMPELTGVLGEIAVERARQEQVWGQQDHRDGTGPRVDVVGDAARPAGVLVGWAQQQCKQAAAAGTVTWLDILREECAEAFAEHHAGLLRMELIQAAAVIVNWVEAIDRRST